MIKEDRVKKIIETLSDFRQRLSSIYQRATDDCDFDAAHERLRRWKDRVIKYLREQLSEKEAVNLEQTELKIFTANAYLKNLADEVSLYDGVLKALIEEIQEAPLLVLQTHASKDPSPTPISEASVSTDLVPQRTPNTANIPYANELYEQIKGLTQNKNSIDEATARRTIELIDDAIKEFGTTNHDKKAELRRLKPEIERILPPETVEALRKRAEGDLLKVAYPKHKSLRGILLWIVGIAVITTPLILLVKELVRTQDQNHSVSNSNSNSSNSNRDTKSNDKDQSGNHSAHNSANGNNTGNARNDVSPTNLLINGGFEDAYPGTLQPEGWITASWEATSKFTWDKEYSRSGGRSAKIEARKPNHARWVQEVSVEPNTLYRLSGWIKTKNVLRTTESSDLSGANLGVFGIPQFNTRGILGTNDWTFIYLDFNSEGVSRITVALQIGTYGAITSGTAWFDDIELVRISKR